MVNSLDALRRSAIAWPEINSALSGRALSGLWSPIYEEARKVVVGDASTLANRRAKALEHLQKFGATAEMVFKKLGVKGVEEITLDHLVMLRGIATALKEGDTTVDEVFADEKPAPATKTDAVKDKLRANAGSAPASQGAGNSSPPEVKPGEPKTILPTFDINAYNINAAEGVKAACKPCTANCSVRDTRRRAFDHPRAGGRGDGRRAAGWAPRSCWRGRC